MGELTRNVNWSANPLGPFETWPQSLQTTLGIVLHSAFPMFLFWGEELICFYNDAFRPSLGIDGKHPSVGKRGKEVWPEIWEFIGPLIEGVRKTGEPVYFEDQLVPFYRNGRIEDIYWTFSYSPAYGDEGKIQGVFVTCTETTEKINTLKTLAERTAQLSFAIDAAELATWDFNPQTNEFTANARYTEWFGLRANEPTNNELALACIADEDRQRVVTALTQALDYEQPSRFDIEYTIRPLGKPERILRAKGKAYFNDQKVAYRFTGTLQDVTEQVGALKELKESEARVRSLVESAPFPIGVYTGRDMRITLVNQALIDVWGKGVEVIGKRFAEVMPELDNQNIYEQMVAVYSSGVPFHAKNQHVDLVVDGKLQPFYFNYSFIPLFDASGNVYGVMSTAGDVTDLIRAKQKIEDSERNLRNMILQAPVAMCIFSGPRFVIEIANHHMFEFWGRPADELLHKPVFEALPEARDQGYEEMMTGVLQTGVAFSAKELTVTLPRQGGTQTVIINVAYEPIRETDDSISGIIAMVLDVTEQVQARKKIEESEQELQKRVAERTLELENQTALLNNILVNSSNGISVTEMIRNEQGDVIDATTLLANDAAVRYAGIPREVYLSKRATELDPNIMSSDYVKTCLKTLETGEPSLIQYYFELTGRWLELTISRMDSNHLIHIFTDVTPIKEAQVHLERTVEELRRSNANLEEFAYAASHDLKEPIRKIHFFSDRLKSTLGAQMTEETSHYFERMELATRRMGSLIDDLLAYSQVSLKPRSLDDVDLNALLKVVLNDLDIEIELKKATITVEPLCHVRGYHRQLQQAFHNLLGNALKYSQPGTPPQIRISTKTVSGRELGSRLVEEEEKKYCLIEITDNGIGFEQKDAERIFNVFTRLHGNSEYKGTGVGLSIVRKIIENHDGFIRAESEPGKGSRFSIYLPLRQKGESENE